MRKLITLIVVAALAWSGYWYLGMQGHKAALSTWFEDRRSEGWQVEYFPTGSTPRSPICA